MNFLLDPDLFDVNQLKMSSMWPPGDIVGLGLLPYIKRLKVRDGEDGLRVLEVGAHKGEGAAYIIENTPETANTKSKIMEYKAIKSDTNPSYEDLLKKNGYALGPKFEIIDSVNPDDLFDVVIVNSWCLDLEKNLNTYYNNTRSSGIFCGNDQALPEVKEALSSFRKTNKIGELIHVSRGSWFWYKR